MERVTGAEVWVASLADPDFAGELSEGPMRLAYKPLIEDAPEVLAGLLEEKITFSTFLRAHIAIIRYGMRGGALYNTMEASNGLSFSSAERSAVEAFTNACIKEFEQVLQGFEGASLTNSSIDEELMLSTEVGLNSANKELYLAGKLTVDKVLRTQPSVLLK